MRAGVAAIVAAGAALPQPALACAACFGRSDSRLAEGMNWGILSLMGVVVFVLGGFAAFFVYLARRAAATAEGSAEAAEAAETEPEPEPASISVEP
jgi:uncharacterized membrane protein HdeD (DUF308 family)